MTHTINIVSTQQIFIGRASNTILYPAYETLVAVEARRKALDGILWVAQLQVQDPTVGTLWLEVPRWLGSYLAF